MNEIYYYDGEWFDTNPKVTGPMDQAFWMGSAVFDGSRAFNGLAPDLILHCERLVESAVKVNMKPLITGHEVYNLCIEALGKLPREGTYYIRPMFFPTEGAVLPIPESTKFILAVHEWEFSEHPVFSACKSSFGRPAKNMAPTDAKACCLYPNIARAIAEAQSRGFDSAIVLDPNGNVAEFEAANLFIVKDGVVHTPQTNGTFLNGLTRRRIISLLREDGFEVEEGIVTFEDVLEADEVFATGNLEKVLFCNRVEDQKFDIGDVAKRARKLYFSYAETQKIQFEIIEDSPL